MGIEINHWGEHEGLHIYRITLSNGVLELTLTNLGCTIVSLLLPNSSGSKKNMVLGYKSWQEYLNDPYYMGCVVGRFANRIAHAAFQIGNRTYQLAANEGGTGNHLHGGWQGLNKKVFTLEEVAATGASVQFRYKSPDGEEGYPGNLDIAVRYTLTPQNEVIIEYKAETDSPTHVNLTNHSYFNLSGRESPATSHELFVNADEVLVAGSDYIPTGERIAVANTHLDFSQWRRIDNQPGALFKGYNECFLLKPSSAKGAAAGLRDPQSGRTMTVRTTLPGLMLYTGDYLSSPFIKNGGVCLETQFFPDSPNHPQFPSTLLQPGDRYQHQTVYQFFL